jgi:CheY-like chemotaxis protein
VAKHRIAEKHRVLVIDDDQNFVNLVSGQLKDAGYQVMAALDPVQGFMSAQRQTPHLILLDVNMPAGGGLPLLKRLSLSPRLRRVPVVVVTATTDPTLEAQVKASGARAFLKKPLDALSLVETISRLLQPSK